ncbi:hypothetical protein JOF48_000248 [Arthrobacter stackebrandtii]|uniref:Fibronectin type-III domain-containing protein n=1 Tax=Arthrobacter stackebrandtii TaxID=272161 RepID=A0ABS4YRS2_9MICC|nr:Ig-like domain-containing protein [Arthrobacter stackebrandtii]MBP2411449.1 hypothetical protein [Arthrobacter stackebrandtii]PYH00271.1 hypothetical protein CVV67_10970 [Arthrobacter stackebrandtii]
MALNALFSKSTSKKQVLTASVAIALSAAVVTGAVVYPGFATADVDLNDGSVWVTNRADGLVGHLNNQAKELDGGFTATTTNFDVIQNAENVFMSSDSGSLLNTVSVPLMAMESETNLGGGKYASQGTNIVALTDPNQGKVWAVSNAGVQAFTDEAEPIITGAGTPVSVTAPDDTIFSADAKAGEIVTTKVDSNGVVTSQERAAVDGMAGVVDLQITVAGGKPVAFSAEEGKLFLPGNKVVEVEKPDGGQLAQASSEGDFVALGTSAGMVIQPLDGKPATVLALPTGGVPAAPVIQNGCVHGAWSGANKYVLSCNGGADFIDIPDAGAKATFVFRKNRDVVVLNDINTGNVWLVNQNMQLVNNWDDLKSKTTKSDDAEEESADPNVVNSLPDRTKPNRPPLATPDSFGVRAGKTTILPVLFNDSDPDGDVLTVAQPAANPSIGAVTSIYNGTGLQIDVPADQAGSGQFEYLANDGRGGTAGAPVNVKIIPESENSAPYAMRDQILVVEQGKTMKQNVLLEWIDPDGDDIYLRGAVSDDDSAVIKTTPDGQLHYTDDGEEIGPKTMTVTVSDGVAVTETKVKVNVKAAGTVPPVANADFARAIVGEPVVLSPLLNDMDPSGRALRLASVQPLANTQISKITDQGTVTFTSKVAGPVYLEYQVTNGPMSATGLIRVDVEEPDDQALPVAVKDLAMLPSGGSVLVDVLGNDSDPSGGVLVVQSAELPGGAPISVTIIERNILKITDVRGLKDTINFKYTIANGAGSAVGEVSVVRIPAPDKLKAPRVEPDEAKVRVGDVVNIPVLDNDIDPNGETLKSPEVTEMPEPELGKLFTDRNELRFIAGPTPKTVNGVYRVTNSTGQYNSAQVTITIVPADPEHNQPPVAKNLTGRVIAGDKVRIPVPLNGIDPDGDSVELVGIDTGASLGTTEIGNGFIMYTASESSAGTDAFTYRVRDRLGAESIGRVEVGVVQPLNMNHPPVTEDDYITMRPERKVAVDVLLNDTDPDGGSLGLLKDGFKGPEGMTAEVDDDGKAVMTSPAVPGIATMMYTATDNFGATATGNVRMTVDPEAPLKAPIARDDRVTVKQMMGKNTVDVPVLENDSDPDGVTDELKVSVAPAPGSESTTATVASVPDEKSGEKTQIVRVQLAPAEQLVPYTLTDQDGLTSTAVVWVPGLDKQYPTLKKTDVIELTAGESSMLKLNDYVQVREGRKPRITEAAKVSMIGAPSKDTIEGDGNELRYTPDIKFYGKGSITFEVTDGTGPDDPEGLKSTLTVMTLVHPAPVKEKAKDEPVAPEESLAPEEKKKEEEKKEEKSEEKKEEKKEVEKKNASPTFTGSFLEVPQQETVTLDVAPMAVDKDPGDKDKLTFEMVSKEPANFDVTFKGTVLTVKQAKGTKVGTKATVQISVSDGSNDPVTSDVQLKATSTSEPVPVANLDVVEDAHAGRETIVNVLENDVNPFPETPLKVVGTTIETDSQGITVSHTDDSVSVKTDANYKGTVLVSYTVEDKTQDEERHVNGKIKVTVKGRPDTATKPQVLEERDQEVLLTWEPPADNGSPLTGYTVNWTGGSQVCDTNTCTITGLTNAMEYQFAVVATNAVGDSDASPLSLVAIPDRIPDAPATPTSEFGDTTATFTWVTPVGAYSAVKSFNVEISPAPAGQNAQKVGVTGNALTWQGLANGTEYQFRVQALNDAPTPSDWSPYSPIVVPAGLPAAPEKPVVTPQSRVGNQNQVAVSWNIPFENGAAITSYTVTQSGGGAAPTAVATSATSQAFTVGTSTEPYSYSVVATNKAGVGPASVGSDPYRAVSKLPMMSAPTLSLVGTGGAGGQVQVTFTPYDGSQMNGFGASEISYCVSLSTGVAACGGSGMTLSSPNGTAVFANVQARATAGGVSGNSDASASSNSVVPYGSPGTPGLTPGPTGGEGDTTVTYSWTYPVGVDTKMLQTKAPGEGWVDRPGNASGRYDTGAYNKSVTIEARTVNSVGHVSPVVSVSPTSGPPKPPPPPVTQWSMYNSSDDTCMDPASGTNWTGSSCRGGHWLNRGETMITNCYIDRPYGSNPGKWYRQVSGPNSANNGLYARWDAFSGADRGQPIPHC